MKANGAPEKIYISPLPNHSDGYVGVAWDEPHKTMVEYVRKDAFIEKVENFLNKKDDRDSYTIGYIRRHLKEIIKEVGL